MKGELWTVKSSSVAWTSDDAKEYLTAHWRNLRKLFKWTKYVYHKLERAMNPEWMRGVIENEITVKIQPESNSMEVWLTVIKMRASME